MSDNVTAAFEAAPAPTQETVTEETQQTSAPEAEEAPEEVVADLQDQAANGTKAEKAEAKKMLRKLSIKVDGEAFDEELPFDLPEEHAEWMRKQLQLSKASGKRFQESTQLKNDVNNFVANLKSDTKNTLMQMGIDPKQFAAMMLEEEIKQQQMTPEQRKQAELEEKIKLLEEKDKKQKEDFEKKEFERLTQQEYERIDNEITSALANSDLPKGPYAIKRIAHYLSLGIKEGVNFSVADILPLVRDEIHNELQELINALGDDKVESFIGKDVLNKIRKKNLTKAKVTPATAKAGLKDVAKTPVAKEPEKVTFKDFFKA